MANQAAQFDLSTAFLDVPKTIAYGLVRGAGNLILQQELTDKTRVSFYMLGEGQWSSILRLWINNKLVTLPNTAIVHFHPGADGEMGNGMTANSTGGDQHVDQFFTLIPGGLDPITFSRYAWLALKVAPDPGAPSAQLTVLADYQAMMVRLFDSSGNQTSFAWTQNPAWWICDFLIRKFVLREGKNNQPLVAAEVARFDWPSFSAAATYYDAVLSGGQKRFSDGGVVFLNDSDTADRALEQMLLMCRSYLLERNGKLSLYADQARASVFTFTSDNVAPLSSRIVPSANVASSAGGKLTFKGRKSNLRAATNRLIGTFRDLNLASGSTDDATRFAISTVTVNHEAHQRSVGARGPGLSVLPKVTELTLDLGVNTPERVWRILKSMLVRQLGDDVDANTAYNAPFSCDLTGYEDSLAVEPGDVVTIDKSLSEEFGGMLVEMLQAEEMPDGTRNFTGLEYMPNAFPDVAPAQQTLQAPTPGTGIPPVPPPAGKNMVANPGFESNVVGTPIGADLAPGSPISDGWTVFSKSAYHTSFLFGGNVRSGGLAILLRLALGVTVPNDSVFYENRVFTLPRTTVSIGDIMRVSAWEYWGNSTAIPAGVTILQRIGFYFYDATGTFLGELSASVTNGAGGFNAWNFQQVAIQVPATMGGGVPAYGFFQCSVFVKNAGAGGFSTGANTYADCYFDDVKLVIQNMAFDLTPLNTSGRSTTAGGALSQVGATTAIAVASKVIQFAADSGVAGDGQRTYNAGSVNPGVVGTYFVYADDPTYSGGAVTYVATLNESDVYANNGRVYFGQITTVGGGGGASTNAPGTGGGRLRLPL